MNKWEEPKLVLDSVSELRIQNAEKKAGRRTEYSQQGAAVSKQKKRN